MHGCTAYRPLPYFTLYIFYQTSINLEYYSRHLISVDYVTYSCEFLSYQVMGSFLVITIDIYFQKIGRSFPIFVSVLFNKCKSTDVVMINCMLKLYGYNVNVIEIKQWNQYNDETCKFLYIYPCSVVYVLIHTYKFLMPVRTGIGH